MKNIVSFVAIASAMFSTPVLARDHYHGDRDRHEYREHHGNSGKWIVPLVGGVILGALLTNKGNSRNDQVDDRYDSDTRVTIYNNHYYDTEVRCWKEIRHDYYYGDYLVTVCR